MNTFEAISHANRHSALFRSPNEAPNLARAFLASNGGKEELYACLRLLDKLGGHAGGYYAGYLDGCHFQINGGADRKIALAELDGEVWTFYCEMFRDEAREFLVA